MFTAAVILLGAICLFIFFYLVTFFTGGWYAPTPASIVAEMLDVAGVRSGDVLVDLGAGDGRILAGAAKRGAKSHGYELNPFLVLVSFFIIRRLHEGQSAKVIWGNFWHHNLSGATVVAIFLPPFKIKAVEKKLTQELAKGTRIVTYHTVFPTMQPTTSTQSGVFLYIR